MSRLMGMFLTIWYTIAGSLIGYYGYFLRTEYEAGVVLDLTRFATYAMEYPMFLVGPMALVIVILAHRFEIMHARTEVSSRELDLHRCTMLKEQLKQELESKEETYNWIRNAIDDAVARQAIQQQALENTEKKDES